MRSIRLTESWGESKIISRERLTRQNMGGGEGREKKVFSFSSPPLPLAFPSFMYLWLALLKQKQKPKKKACRGRISLTTNGLGGSLTGRVN